MEIRANSSIKRRVLDRVVEHSGVGLWGGKAVIRFSPANRPGWYWRPKVGGKEIPIRAAAVRHQYRRLVLESGVHQLQIYEHIGSLRFTGLDGVIIESTRCPPYDGRPWELWQKLAAASHETEEVIPWQRLTVELKHEPLPGRWVQAQPTSDLNPLDVHVQIRYPKLGSLALAYHLPSDDLTPVLQALPQGWPRWWYNVSQLGGALHAWLHHNRVVWPQRQSVSDTLRLFALHRLSDILGAISVTDHEALPSCTIVSNCGGHITDIGLLQKMQGRTVTT